MEYTLEVSAEKEFIMKVEADSDEEVNKIRREIKKAFGQEWNNLRISITKPNYEEV
jgi:predicted molibdopterin-dependent oxidoreductase YjgC